VKLRFYDSYFVNHILN